MRGGLFNFWPKTRRYISVGESRFITAECKHGYDLWLAVSARTLMHKLMYQRGCSRCYKCIIECAPTEMYSRLYWNQLFVSLCGHTRCFFECFGIYIYVHCLICIYMFSIVTYSLVLVLVSTAIYSFWITSQDTVFYVHRESYSAEDSVQCIIKDQ